MFSKSMSSKIIWDRGIVDEIQKKIEPNFDLMGMECYIFLTYISVTMRRGEKKPFPSLYTLFLVIPRIALPGKLHCDVTPVMHDGDMVM